jgi:MFS family permease
MTSHPSDPDHQPWYRNVALSQWLILIIASAGWVFDVYEGQIFNLTRTPLLKELLGPGANGEAEVNFYGEVFLGIFLAGGAFGGIAFGALADRWGRRPILVLTILTYSLFSGLTYFATSLWQAGLLRFLVALGVGGEWSVAAAMVAEAFADRGRAHAGSIFHATSILGTWLAGLAAYAVGSNWRYVYLLGVLPALLVVVLRLSIAETPRKDLQRKQGGNLGELLADARWRRRAFLGLLLAAVGLGTFWGVTVEGQRLADAQLLRDGVSPGDAAEQAKLAYTFIETTGGGLGLLAFGPLAARWGRRPTFFAFHIAAFLVTPLTCYAPQTFLQLALLLPFYGFFTLGIHAGYAIYFPELFPARLRATAGGVCFNGGRVAASVVLLVISPRLKEHLPLPLAVSLLGTLFLFGVLLVWFLPETKDQPLPE